ncbi:unnamed protein product [Rotaria sordida]|uniref:PLAT domain-containing protein n=1 Tax=Rotaria sordida TaxID=392033 RepID=A0A818FZP8_9BILA|nr:unnamed protein product [Rotaria sordida]
MITTKADKLLRSLIDAGLSLTDFTILAIKIMRIQRDFKTDNKDRRQRDYLRQQNKLREQYHIEQQLKDEEQRKIKGLVKLRELGYVTSDDTSQIPNNNTTDSIDQYSINHIGNKDTNKIKTNQLLLPYSKEINDMKQKQRDCCLTFNIDYDLRLHQQALERACRRAKRNIYELRAERFNRPEYRSILSVETTTSHNKLKQAIREINKIFLDSKSNQDKRHLQELLTYINQFEGDIDLLMCQMQYEPKVKETILFSSVTNDILDRMNLILYCARKLSEKISIDDNIDEINENIDKEINNDLLNIPTKLTYIIKIKTNNEINSSLSNDTNVKIKLYGTYNKTSDIILTGSNNKNKWQSGQIDLFNIELNYLGDIYAIEIWHDSQYSSWKVDWIEIIDDAANIYRFPLNRLFDKYSNEKKTHFIIQRDIGPVNHLPSKPFKQIKPYKKIGFATYTIQVKTGKQPNKVTDSSIFIQVKGENGNFADNLSSANSAFKNSVFEPDQLDTFYFIWPYLAKINSLQLLIQSEGTQPLWFCEYIIVQDDQTENQYKFIINQLFDGSNPDNRNLIRHLTVYPENMNQTDTDKEKEKPGYLIKLKTGEKGLSNMSTLPSINIILKGDKGKSEPYTLKSLDNKRILFQENQTDEFLLSSKYYVGPIKSLQLLPNGEIDKWFIETIIIRDITQGQDYIFPIYKWVNTEDGTNNLTVQPINERKADYIIYTRTITSELKGPDRTIKLLIQGNKGKHEIELNNPITMYNTFQPGHKDEYYIENIKSLGELQSIEIDITHPNIHKLGLDYIEINDLKTNDSYRFNINRMLDSKNPKMIAKAEPISRFIKNPTSTKTSHNRLSLSNIPSTMSAKKNFDQLTMDMLQGAKPSTNNNFTVSIKTGDSSLMDTDSKVQLQLHGDKGISEKIDLHKSETNSKNLFEKDNYDTFSLNIPDIGNLKSATLSIDGKIKTEWSISTFEIIEENSKKNYKANINKKLSNINNELIIHLNEFSSNFIHHMNESSKNNSEKNSYKINIKTINKEFLDQDIKLQIELIDEYEQSEIIILNEIDNNQIHTFTIDSIKDLGKLKNIKLSLIGSKLNKDYFYQPEFIEIFHPKSNKIYHIRYTEDDFLNSDKNQLIKSIQFSSDINMREITQSQGTVPSTITTSTNQSMISPYEKLPENILSENDEEDSFVLDHTNPSLNSQNLIQETNSFSEKLTYNSSRQIRPGDRVKTKNKKKIINQQTISSSYESNSYRQSIETIQEYRNKTKPMQLISNRQTPQTNILKNRHHDENQKFNHQLSKDKNMNSRENLLPNKSSLRSVKQPQTTKKNKIPHRLSLSKLSSNTQQYLNELQTKMMDVKIRSNSNIFDKNQSKKKGNKNLNVQQLSINKKLNNNRYSYENYFASITKQYEINDRSNKKNKFHRSSFSSSSKQAGTEDQKQMSRIKRKNSTNNPEKMLKLIESLTLSNTSEQSNSTKTSTTNFKQSKTSIISSNTFDILLQKTGSHNKISLESNIISMNTITNRSRIDNSNPILINKQNIETKSIRSTPKKTHKKVTTSNPLSNHSVSILSKSVPLYSRIQNNISQRRSRSVSPSQILSNRINQVFNKKSSNISSSSSSHSNQILHTSNPLITESYFSELTSNPTRNSTHIQSLSNQLSKLSTSNQTTKQNHFKQSQLTSDPNFNEYNLKTNTHDVNAVTIHTIATKSHSDENSIQRSIDNHGNEHSLQTKSLLSPDKAKKSCKNHQRNISRISDNILNKQKFISQPSIITSDLSTMNKLNEDILSKDNSDIQDISHSSASNKSKSDNIPLDIDFKTSNNTNETIQTNQDTISKQYDLYTNESLTQEIKSRPNTIELSSKDNHILSQYAFKSSLNTSTTTTNNLLISARKQNHNLPNEIFDIIKYPTISNKQSIITPTNSNLPIKLLTIDHMSTVYEESESSANSILNELTPSTSEYNYNQETIQDWLETSSNLSSNQLNLSLNYSNKINKSSHL